MKFAIAALVAVMTLSGCASSTAHHHHDEPATVQTIEEGSPFRGAWLQTPYALPNAQLRDTDGHVVQWPADGLPYPITILFFGYTNCDDGFCQAQTALAAAAIRQLPPDLRSQAGLVFVTVDPARDSGPVLRGFLDNYDVPSTGLSADFQTVADVALHFGIAVEPPPAHATEYEVAHGTALVGFGKRHTAPVLWLPESSADDIAADIKVLAAGSW